MPGSDPKSWSPESKSGSGEKTADSGGPTLKKASTNHSAMEMAMLLYPLFENRWLYLVKALHTYALSAVPLKIADELGEKAVAKAIANAEEAAKVSSERVSVLESAIDDILLKMKAAEKKIKEYEEELSSITDRPYANFAQFNESESCAIALGIKKETILLKSYESKFSELTKEIIEMTEREAKDAEKLAALKS